MSENDNSMNEVVQELRKIKIFTGMTGVALTLMLISSILSTFLSVGALALIMPNALKTIEKQKQPSFRKTVEDLVKQDKLDEALTEISVRKETHPNDPYVYYWEAKAFLFKGEPEKTLICLKKTQELAPGWEEEYITPYAKLAKKQIDDSTQEK